MHNASQLSCPLSFDCSANAADTHTSTAAQGGQSASPARQRALPRCHPPVRSKARTASTSCFALPWFLPKRTNGSTWIRTLVLKTTQSCLRATHHRSWGGNPETPPKASPARARRAGSCARPQYLLCHHLPGPGAGSWSHRSEVAA